MHKLIIDGLSDFEADHIGEILSDYKRKMLMKKLEAIVEDHKDGGGRAVWFDEHLVWHDEIMSKVKWSKE